MRFSWPFLGAVGLAVLAVPPAVSAQPKGKAKPVQQRSTTKGAKPTAGAADDQRGSSKPASAKKAEGEAEVEKKASGGGTKLPEVVEVEEGEEGVKTYKFGPVEVEGRLKSPQVIYFLRRVRAEFSAGDLGHRSFMRELSDTRRHRAFR